MKPVKPILLLILVACLNIGSICVAQSARVGGHTVLVVPFENTSKAPGIDWIGEAFSEILGNRLAAAQLFVIRREDRVYAFDRLGLPANIRPSRATIFHLAEEMDVDYVVVGTYTFDGRNFTAHAQLLDMKKVHLSPDAVEAGALTQLAEIQNDIAWDILRDLDPQFETSKNAYLAASPSIRLDALENYVRGTMATMKADKIKYFKEAIRIAPDYWQAALQIAKTHFDSKEYDAAALWFSKIPKTAAFANEATFFLGLSYYYTGNFEKAEEAFSFVARRVPLIEVYNDLGVAQARRGKKSALQYFQHAAEADSQDADYRFNLALALSRNGDRNAALHELKAAASLRPQDIEIKALLEKWGIAASQPSTDPQTPVERIKRNYDETSYRQLALEIQNANEERYAALPPAQHAAIHVSHGEDFLRDGLFDQAENDFREALLLDGANARAHLGLAKILEERNELATARSEAAASNRLKMSADAFLVIARADMKQNKPDSAKENVKRALRIDANNAAALELKRSLAYPTAQVKP